MQGLSSSDQQRAQARATPVATAVAQKAAADGFAAYPLWFTPYTSATAQVGLPAGGLGAPAMDKKELPGKKGLQGKRGYARAFGLRGPPPPPRLDSLVASSANVPLATMASLP